MSTWTHVAACIRFDEIRLRGEPDAFPDFGHTVSDGDGDFAWGRCDVPCGSEGSLQYHILENRRQYHMAAYTVMIWGDLRDYDDEDEILAYLSRICAGRMIRQGVAEIAVEGQAPLIAQWNDDKWDTTRVA